jgi:protocadherin Fat 4
LAEGVGRGTTVLTVEAQDADSGPNGKIAYSLAGFETGSAETFAIDPANGVIRTVGDIDRETVDTYRFTVVATDQAEGVPRQDT